MKQEIYPHRVLIKDYLAVTRRIAQLLDDKCKATREAAENLICRGL